MTPNTNTDNSGNKYRPTFTEAQIDSILAAISVTSVPNTPDLANATNILAKLSKKIKADCVSASYSLKQRTSLEDSLGMNSGMNYAPALLDSAAKMLDKRKLAAIQYILNPTTCSPNTCELASDFITGNESLFSPELVAAIWAQDDYLYSVRNTNNLFGSTEVECANLVARIHTHAI